MAESDRTVHYDDSVKLIDSHPGDLGHFGPVRGVQIFGSINSSESQHHSFPHLSSSVSSTASSVVPLLHVYRRRWYILFIFTVLSVVQGGLLNSWTVITSSVEAAFGWSDPDLQIMQMWLYVSYLIVMLPFTWLMDKKGMRISVVLTVTFMTAGCALRCISITPPLATWLAHIAQFVIGLAGPVVFTAGPTISALWFPPEQRTTATAIATIAGFSGAAVCFIYGPLIVEDPIPVPVPIGPHTSPNISYANVEEMKNQIILCRYIETGVCALILIIVLIFFPSRPPISPSLTAAIGKLDFKEGLCDLFRKQNANFWLVCIAYSLSVSIYGVWSSLFGVILKDVMDESDIGWLGFAAVMAGCLAAVVFGRLSDLFVGRMKAFLLVLNVGCVLSSYWFVIVAQQYVAFSRVSLFAAAVVQGLCNNGAIPLYYELAIESTYPVAEVVTSMMMTVMYNVLPLIFLAINYTTEEYGGASWMNFCLYFAVILSFPLMLKFREEYRRLAVDKGRVVTPMSIEVSTEQNDENPTLSPTI